MKIFNRFLISILTCFLFVMSVGAEEPLVEDTETPLVYNAEEGTSENPENVAEGTTEGVVEGDSEMVIDSSEPTSEGIASTESEVETLQEENSSVESLPELATFEKEIVYNEEHTIATVILTYTGECTEVNIANADEIQEFVNIGVYRANMKKGDWEASIAFDILLNGMVYFEINVWNNDDLVGTVPVRCSITGLNNDQLIFDPNQEPTTYEITSSDVGSSDSRNMTLSYKTNVSFTWSIPTELSMADIEDDLTVTVNNSNLATETALRIRVASNNDYKLIESESGESLLYMMKDLSDNLIHNNDVILDHLYNQDTTSNSLHFKLTQMPVISGEYNDTLTFTASVERMLQELYSGQVVTLSNLGTTHTIAGMKIYGVSKQDGIPSPDNPVEIESVVNPTVKVCGGNYTYLLNDYQRDYLKNDYSSLATDERQVFLIINSGGCIIRSVNFDIVDSNGNPHCTDVNLTSTYSGYFGGADYASNNSIICIHNTSRDDLPIVNINDFLVNLSNVQTETLPYTLNAIPVSSGGNVTVNGQQYISDYVDIENKKLHRYIGEVDLGTFDWDYSTEGIMETNFYLGNNPENYNKAYILCDKYETGIFYSSGLKLSNNQIAYSTNSIRIRDDNHTDASEFKDYISGTKLYFVLLTPTEKDLTDAEVQAFKDLYTYSPTTVVSCSSNQLTPYIEFSLS